MVIFLTRAVLILAPALARRAFEEHGIVPDGSSDVELEPRELNPRAHLPICDAVLVRRVCQALEPDSNGYRISKETLRETFSAYSGSISNFWDMLALSHGNEESMLCSTLCQEVADYFREQDMLPPRSNLGCTGFPPFMECDVDLTMAHGRSELPDLHDKELTSSPGAEIDTSGDEAGPSAEMKIEHKPRPIAIAFNEEDLFRRVANLFSIYPPVPITFADRTGSLKSSYPFGMVPERRQQQLKKVQLTRTPGTKSWGLTLKYSADNGIIVKKVNQNSPAAAAGLEDGYLITSINGKDYKRFCCGNGGSGMDNTKLKPELAKGVVTLMVSEDEEDDPGHLPDQSMPLWLVKVNARSLQAQKYIDTALKRCRDRDTKDSMDAWFGADAYTDNHKRSEILRVMNSVNEMLGNVKYIYPGKQCEKNTFAYVFPRGKKSRNANGQFIFCLCPLYMKSDVAVQIETLVHEASHHAIAYTDDVCADDVEDENAAKPIMVTKPLHYFGGSKDIMDEMYTIDGRTAVVRFVTDTEVTLQIEPPYATCKRKAYGRESCSKLAKGTPEQAIKAIRNADNFCYYVQDVTDGVNLHDI